MRMNRTLHNDYGTPDEENPEWTKEDFKNARPAREFFTEAEWVKLTTHNKNESI